MQVSNVLKASQILDYSIEKEKDPPDNPLCDRCHLNWQDYTMIAIVAVTVSFFIASIVIAQFALATGLGIALVGLGLGEYYIYNYADYYNLKEQIIELDNITKELEETNASLREEVSALHHEVLQLQEQTRTFASSNETYKAENALLKETARDLAESNEKLKQTEADLRNLADVGLPNALRAYNTLRSQLEEGARSIQTNMITEAQLLERIQASTRQLDSIRETINREALRLESVAGKIETHVNQFPELQRIVAELRKTQYHNSSDTDQED